ncbi:MAG: hypothetical protein LBR00_05150 [Clostridiales Family XIII bacterium]|jgi:branched-subunit amino acid transport protein|nr:hypothetical protein [Clostridiales Family XIII bacterium]
MLSKLIKYEFKATARTFFWIYAAFVVIMVLNALFNPITLASHNNSFASDDVPVALAVLSGALIVLYFAAIVAVVVVTFVFILLRFWRSMNGDLGYLTLTLPATREQHLGAKVIVATVWNIVSGVLVVLSIFLMMANTGGVSDIFGELRKFAAEGVPIGGWTATVIVLVIVGSATGSLMLFAAMSWGPVLLKNHRVGGSFLAYIILYAITQIVMGAVLLVIGLSNWGAVGPVEIGGAVPLGGPGSTFDVAVADGADAPLAFADGNLAFSPADISSVTAILLITLVINVAFGVAYWFFTRAMLNRKQNLA